MKECAACSRCLDDELAVCPADGFTPRAAIPGPRLLDGKYLLEQRLGEGGMGVVYRARHLALGRDVALKLVRPAIAPDPLSLSRFRTEAAVLGQLEHPGIVNVTDFGVDPREGGLLYLAMELLGGESLDERLRRGGPLSLELALPILEGVATAVDYAHARGVLHRDLKPSNVLLVRESDGRTRPKLLDFGLARLLGARRVTVAATPVPGADPTAQGIAAAGALDASLDEPVDDVTPAHGARSRSEGGDTEGLGRTRTEFRSGGLGVGVTRPGQLLGTPRFMAPELFARGESSAATDVYALGVMAVLLVTGHTPFGGSVSAVARGHLEEAPPRPSSLHAGVPASADEALLSALAKDPADRPKTASAFVERLRAAVETERLQSWRARELPRRAVLAAVIGLLLALLAPLLGALPPLAALERAAVDARFALAKRRAADPRLALVLLDEASLAAESRSLADLAEPVAAGLERIAEGRAAAIAVDLVLPEAWGRSRRFVQLVVSQADRLTLAAISTPDGVVGAEAVSGLATVALGADAAAGLFGLVNLEEDADGVVRRGRLSFATRDGGSLEAWAVVAARRLGAPLVPAPPRSRLFSATPRGTFLLALRAPPPPALAWRDLGERLRREPRLFEGKLVILGARLAGSGDDALRVPSGAVVPGAVVQALTIDTILAGFPIRDAPVLAVFSGLGLCAGSVLFAALALASVGRPLGVAVLLVGVWLVVAAAAFRALGWFVPVAGPLAAVGLAAPSALLLRRWLPRHPLARGTEAKL